MRGPHASCKIEGPDDKPKYFGAGSGYLDWACCPAFKPLSRCLGSPSLIQRIDPKKMEKW